MPEKPTEWSLAALPHSALRFYHSSPFLSISFVVCGHFEMKFTACHAVGAVLLCAYNDTAKKTTTKVHLFQ